MATSTALSTATDGEITPTWETQKNARTYLLSIPAPRGQITDRHGNPLAQTRVSQNLALIFPTPLNFSDAEAVEYAQLHLGAAKRLLPQRSFPQTRADVLKHYRNRGVLPFPVAGDLLPEEIEQVRGKLTDGLVLLPTYVRFYPNGPLAGHILGYCGRRGGVPDAPLQNNDLLWPEVEGRDGIEQTFDAQLTGRVGQLNIVIDRLGSKASERISIPPQPGFNVITTLDERIQRLCEQTLAKQAKRGALVFIEPRTGDILAMASHPCYNPNLFTPSIDPETFKALNEDPDKPLLPRAFRSAYPPGSTFKIVSGLAAVESGAVSLRDYINCPSSYRIGGIWFSNWKASGSGQLNFREAFTESCNTWFYQAGLRTGADPIIDWSFRLGLGARTGIPLRHEAEGRIPTHDYFQKTRGRRIMDGDVANMSIGQGDVLASPLQMAQLAAIVANNGTLMQTRIVRQVQTLDQQIVVAYEVRAKSHTGIRPDTLDELRKAMVDVVYSGRGTAGRARVKGFKVAGKTGTAQWGPKHKERTAAWFVGFAPVDEPEFAFASVFEAAPGVDAHGGSEAAPMVAAVLKGIAADRAKSKKEEKARKKAESKEQDEESDEGAEQAKDTSN